MQWVIPNSGVAQWKLYTRGAWQQWHSWRGHGVNHVVTRSSLHRFFLHYSCMKADWIIIFTFRQMEIDLFSYRRRIPVPTPYVTVQMTYDALTHIWYICYSWHNRDWLDECLLSGWEERFISEGPCLCWCEQLTLWMWACYVKMTRRVIRGSESQLSVFSGAVHCAAI